MKDLDQQKKNFQDDPDKKKTKILGFFPDQWLVLIALTAVSLLVHLPKLSHPPIVIFDEVHFGGFISDYINGICFFDIHPPFSKLLLAGYAYATGYRGDFNFSNFEGKYTSNFYTKIRFLPAFLCSLASPLLTASLMLQNVPLSMSALCGILFMFEFNAISQSRMIVTDGMLYFFVALAVFMTALEERYESGYFLIALQTLAASFAFSTKFTAAGLFILIALSHLKLVMRRPHWFLVLAVRGAFVSIIFLVFFYSIIVIHLKAMPNPGFGDRYMPQNFRNWPMYKRVLGLVLAMYRYNADLSFTHPYQSKWYEWPFLLYRPLLVFSSYQQGIYLFSNPVSSILSLVGFFIALYAKEYTYAIIYLVSYAPFISVSRCMFSYHYEIPLMFGILCFCKSIPVLVKSKRKQSQITIEITVIAIVCYIFWFPLIYGLKYSQSRYMAMMILSKVRDFIYRS